MKCADSASIPGTMECLYTSQWVVYTFRNEWRCTSGERMSVTGMSKWVHLEKGERADLGMSELVHK